MAVAIMRDLRAGEVIVARAYFSCHFVGTQRGQSGWSAGWSAFSKVMSSIALKD